MNKLPSVFTTEQSWYQPPDMRTQGAGLDLLNWNSSVWKEFNLPRSQVLKHVFPGTRIQKCYTLPYCQNVWHAVRNQNYVLIKLTSHLFTHHFCLSSLLAKCFTSYWNMKKASGIFCVIFLINIWFTQQKRKKFPYLSALNHPMCTQNLETWIFSHLLDIIFLFQNCITLNRRWCDEIDTLWNI